MKKYILCFLIFLGACAAPKKKILDATWVSMRSSTPPVEANLVKVGNVQNEYCAKEWTGHYGLIDEVTKKAQDDYRADYIKNASYTANMSCISIYGQAYREK